MKYTVNVEPFTNNEGRELVIEADSAQEAGEKAERISDSWVQHGEICWEANDVQEIK